MKSLRISGLKWMTVTIYLAVLSLVTGVPAWAQGEKRTVFAPYDFHWQGKLKAGQTLEVINQNGGVDGSGAAGDEARVENSARTGDDDGQLFIEVVEYSDGVTICAVHARNKEPGRCHRGGVSSESWSWSWHGSHTKINFRVQVPRGAQFHAMTTNGNVTCHDLNSVVDASTTNGNVEVSTSEWGSARTTNGGVRVSIGNAKWTGELEEKTTNGSVDVTLPAAAEFRLDAATTNGNIHTDFPITVQGSFSSMSLSGTVGSGGRELRVHTTNGTIKLGKN